MIASSPEAREVIKPLAMGKDIRRWKVVDHDRWLIYMYHGVGTNGLSAVLNHLRPYRKQLEARATKQEWYELQQPQALCAAEFSKPKIVYPDIAKEPRFALDLMGGYLGNTAYAIGDNRLYLLGLLNSSSVYNYYVEVSSQVRGGYLRFIYQYVARIPIPDAPAAERATISALVQKCLDAKGMGCDKEEKEIDEHVAALYGL